MKIKKFDKQSLLLILILAKNIVCEDDLEPKNETANDNQDSHLDEVEPIYSSSTISEKVKPDAMQIREPNEHKPHHHPKQKNPVDDLNTDRRPVYEVVNQPCYTPGCGGFSPQEGFVGSRWQQPNRNRQGPYPRYYEPRRRGGYREYLPAPGYGQSYGPPPYPDYGYGQRGMPLYPPERFDRMGGYGRPPYDDYFMG